MNTTDIRVRFAPAPTGLMHLGNVRTALMNYLFSRQKQGTFVLRIEDTDQQRNFDPEAKEILDDLAWLSLKYDEGPHKGGPYAPYVQSQRESIYQEKLTILREKNLIYRCFCSVEELEKKRQRQVALKQPPRYDRTCLSISPEIINQKIDAGTPFIWRMKLDQSLTVIITDLAYGKLTFDYKNFSDFPLTRQDGSVTFIFANFVDDFVMKISHVLRGEDHLTNTACQAALFHAFNAPLPLYWHLPLLFNIEGKKLSKRDFGFSLKDLRDAGYLPQAVCNYLAIIGGGSFTNEIMSLDELVATMNFESIHSTGQIKYDVVKLTWINHKWIERLEPDILMHYCLPFLHARFPQAKTVDSATLSRLIQTIKSELTMLAEIGDLLHFYFVMPGLTKHDLELKMGSTLANTISTLILENVSLLKIPEQFLDAIKKAAKEQKIAIKDLFTFMRLVLMGETEGPSIHDLFSMLGAEEVEKRINKVLA